MMKLERLEKDWYSIVTSEMVTVHPNHSAILEADMDIGEERTSLYVYRGLYFTDSEGNTVEPLGYLSLSEVNMIRDNLEKVNDDGVITPRELSYDWNVVSDIIAQGRLKSTEIEE